MRTAISVKLAEILKKELSYTDFALTTLKDEARGFEKEYSMSSKDFLNKFEKGELGDERKWFNWYGLALNLKDWYDTKKEIEKTLRVA